MLLLVERLDADRQFHACALSLCYFNCRLREWLRRRPPGEAEHASLNTLPTNAALRASPGLRPGPRRKVFQRSPTLVRPRREKRGRQGGIRGTSRCWRRPAIG